MDRPRTLLIRPDHRPQARFGSATMLRCLVELESFSSRSTVVIAEPGDVVDVPVQTSRTEPLTRV